MKRFSLVIIAVLLLAGCSQNKNEGEVKEVVGKYTALLAEGYRNLNMNPLSQVATEERATKAYHHMAALGEARTKMDAQLKEIKFLNVKFVQGDKAEVKTEENWDYTYINIDSGKPEFDNSVAYALTYFLTKKSGKWLVADVTVEKAEEKKSSENIFNRPKDKQLPEQKGNDQNRK